MMNQLPWIEVEFNFAAKIQTVTGVPRRHPHFAI